MGIRFTASGTRSLSALRLRAFVDASFAPEAESVADPRSCGGTVVQLPWAGRCLHSAAATERLRCPLWRSSFASCVMVRVRSSAAGGHPHQAARARDVPAPARLGAGVRAVRANHRRVGAGLRSVIVRRSECPEAQAEAEKRTERKLNNKKKKMETVERRRGVLTRPWSRGGQQTWHRRQ